MKQSVIPNYPNQRKIVEDNIAKGYANGDEMVLGERYSQFKREIEKGEVAIITPDEMADDYGGKFFTPAQKQQFEKGLDDLLAKGEDASTGWTEGEAEFYEKAVSDLGRMERRALPIGIEKGVESGPVVYAEVYVLKNEEAVAD